MLHHCGTQVIETERLCLRPFCDTDEADMLVHWVSDPLVQHMYAEPVYSTHEEVQGLLNRYIASYQKSDTYRWAIILRETGICIGQIAFFFVDSNNHFGEIEYCIGRAFQKQGLATEATKAVLAFGFEQIGFHKIQICHRATNPASRRVIEKCGFVYEGALRDFFYDREQDVYIDRLYYSLLKTEWEALRSTSLR